MKLIVEHDTHSAYAPEVEEAWHLAYLQPLGEQSEASNGPQQQLISHEVTIDPEPEHRRVLRDPFGNTAVWFSLHQSHRSVRVIARSRLDTASPAPTPPERPWEQVREAMRYRAGARFDAASEFLHPSPLIAVHDEFAAHASASFTPGRGMIEASADYCARIHREFRYDPESTDVSTPVLEALRAKHGVCQDFAHVLIAGLRAIGLSARYVSGYLLTEPIPGQPRLIGVDASHAWASVYVPAMPDVESNDTGTWVDLDPTNDRWGAGTPGEDYVCLAIGRDYSDVTPLRGVIHGAQRQSQTVAVTVMPV